jgi:hypothetical protein
VPGLWSGLKCGCRYSAGINGGLAAHDGSAETIGMGASASDFIFFGANNVR